MLLPNQCVLSEECRELGYLEVTIKRVGKRGENGQLTRTQQFFYVYWEEQEMPIGRLSSLEKTEEFLQGLVSEFAGRTTAFKASRAYCHGEATARGLCAKHGREAFVERYRERPSNMVLFRKKSPFTHIDAIEQKPAKQKAS